MVAVALHQGSVITLRNDKSPICYWTPGTDQLYVCAMLTPTSVEVQRCSDSAVHSGGTVSARPLRAIIRERFTNPPPAAISAIQRAG